MYTYVYYRGIAMSKEIKRLPDAELEVMLIVWEAKPPVTAGYILERLKDRSWSLQTLFTVLTRLEGKGFLSCEKQGRSKRYYPSIDADSYKQLESQSFLERLYNNSFKNMIASLVDSKALDQEDIRELRDYLNQLEER